MPSAGAAAQYARAALRSAARTAGRANSTRNWPAQSQAARSTRPLCWMLGCRIAWAKRWSALVGTPPDRPAAEFSKADRRRLVQIVKRLDIPVAGTMGFRKAEVTAGGVALEEVDSRTMQSRIVPGLYFAGELLDLNGPWAATTSRPPSAPAGWPAKTCRRGRGKGRRGKGEGEKKRPHCYAIPLDFGPESHRFLPAK